MYAAVYKQDNTEAGKVLLPKEIFGQPMKASFLHQVITAQAANRRQGNAHTKNRGEVRGGGKKSWRQKGTGRARAGSLRSPLFRGGGTVFGPRHSKDWKQKINQKVKKQALFLALSSKVREGTFFLVEDLKLKENKTKFAAGFVKNVASQAKTKDLGQGKTLVVLASPDENVFRSFRNLKGFAVDEVRNLSALQVISCRNILMAKEAVAVLKKTFLSSEKTALKEEVKEQ